jgi:hypothetical protein
MDQLFFLYCRFSCGHFLYGQILHDHFLYSCFLNGYFLIGSLFYGSLFFRSFFIRFIFYVVIFLRSFFIQFILRQKICFKVNFSKSEYFPIFGCLKNLQNTNKNPRNLVLLKIKSASIRFLLIFKPQQ